jgi:hypothetical protein
MMQEEALKEERSKRKDGHASKAIVEFFFESPFIRKLYKYIQQMV